MQVTVYGALRGITGDKTVDVPFDGGTVRDALAAFAAEYPRAKRRLYDDGDVASGLRVVVDGEVVGPGDDCRPEATLALLPAVRGG